MGKKLIAVAVVSLALAGCTSTLQDLEGIQAETPDRVRVFLNADQFPNLNVVCINGVGFVNTTRDYQQMTELSDQAYSRLCGEEAQ